MRYMTRFEWIIIVYNFIINYLTSLWRQAQVKNLKFNSCITEDTRPLNYIE
jgi:hypothetical protein